MNAPPASGPATEAIALTPPTEAKNMGRCFSGTIYAMTVNAPEKIPAPPDPAIARPTISATEVGATPQINEPTVVSRSIEWEDLQR